MEFLLIFLYLVREHKYYPKNILYNLDKYYERWVGVRGREKMRCVGWWWGGDTINVECHL